MKTQEHRTEKQRYSRLEADLDAATKAIFSRCPTLCGFAVRDGSNGLFLTEVSVFPQRDLEAPMEIRSEIVAALVALIDECPEAGALLRERSFARTFH